MCLQVELHLEWAWHLNKTPQWASEVSPFGVAYASACNTFFFFWGYKHMSKSETISPDSGIFRVPYPYAS